MLQGYIILLYLIFANAEQYGARSISGYEYIQGEDTWLRLHIVPATWEHARLRCHLEGGVLASPTSSGLTEAMTSMMAGQNLIMKRVFIGINALISKGDFMSLEGLPLENTTIHWAEGEPNNLKNDEDCLVMSATGEIIDVRCGNPYPYFCRKENAKMSINKCGNTDQSYRFEPKTGSCYKFHRLGRKWHRAAMVCRAEGAHLAVINSQVEAQVLKELFEKNKEGLGNWASVGFWDWNEHGEWLTVFGERLFEAGYSNWGKGEPNNQHGSEFCGAIGRDGKLNDYHCDIRVPFICEITLK